MDIRRLVWDGSIPLELSLNDSEGLLCETSTRPFYMMARRMLYFPLLITEIKRHFGSISQSTRVTGSSSVSSFSSSISNNEFSREDFGVKGRSISSMNGATFSWFTCKFRTQNLLIPPHLPIGLLYDLLEAEKGDLPWRIEFHISTKEEPSLSFSDSAFSTPICIDEQLLSSIYFSSLKEADYLRSGSAKNVMNLSRSEQLQLLETLRGGDFDKFWRINQKLLNPNHPLKNLPIRFWILHPTAGRFDKIQFLIGSEGSEELCLKALIESEFSVNIEKVICHGVELPIEEVNLRQLASNWGHADNFVNLLLIKEQK